MPLADFFNKLKSGAGDVFSPGVEELLSSVPLLLGQYESGRGAPIGGPLQTLGQLGLSNAQNRIVQHQKEGDVAGQIENLAARGLLPKDFYSSGSAESILGSGKPGTGMTPEAASTSLTNIENTEATKQQNELARTEAEQDKVATEQRQLAQRKAYFDYTHKTPANINDIKTKAQALLYGIKTGDMKPYKSFEAQETADAVDRLDRSKVGVFNSLLSAQVKRLPLAAIPGIKTVRPINLDTMTIGNPKEGTGEWADTTKFAWVDPKTATEVIPQIKGMVAATRDLANFTKGMPAASSSTAWNLVNTTISGLKTRIAARGGSPQERAFMANRIRLALMMQKVLTTSSRPLNLVEYNRVTGEAEGLSSEGEALIPTATDTRESAALKERSLIGMAREKFQDLGLDSPVSHYYGGLVRDSANEAASAPSATETSTPEPAKTPTGTEDEEGWKTF